MDVKYDLGNLADWVSAFGTVGAVFTALYLSRKDRKPHARVTAKFSYPVDLNYNIIPVPLNITAEIVNIGLVPIYITECTIQESRRKRHERMFFTDGSHKVNKMLQSGEFYEHSLNFQPIKHYFQEKGIIKRTTYIHFTDATGKKYKSKIKIRLE